MATTLGGGVSGNVGLGVGINLSTNGSPKPPSELVVVSGVTLGGGVSGNVGSGVGSAIGTGVGLTGGA